MKLSDKEYKEMYIRSNELEIPRRAYQRSLNVARVRQIAKHFDERIANEPKVSLRNGHYYVFDGQHTIAARVERNGGKPLAILCKVYLGLSESDEATLFAEQNGFSADLTAGVKLRALIYAGDPLACSFQKATEGTGITLDFSQQGGTKRLACIATAFNEFRKIGPEKYKEALTILLEAWDGAFDSLRAESVSAMCEFVDLYEGEYDRKRLIRRFRGYDPINIFRKGRAMGDNMPGYKKYLYQVWAMYNGTSVKSALPLKF